MKIFSIALQFLAFSTLLFIPFAISAQDTKKEVHIKITENGIVTKDTTYNTSADSLEIERFFEPGEHHKNMGEKHVVEKRVVIKSDDANTEETMKSHVDEQKEVRVTVQSGDDQGDDVEEIWIDGNGAPCHTIIIHEGDCQGGKMETNYRVIHVDGPGHVESIMPPRPPKHSGRRPGYVEKKIIRTGDGEKVIIIETRNDGRDKGRRKGKY